MSVGLIAALKVIPWGDVVDVAPAILKAAKRHFDKSKVEATVDALPATSTALVSNDKQKLDNFDVRLRSVQAKLIAAISEQKASAELIKALAEQNERVVKAIDIIKARTKYLSIACVVLFALVIALAAWISLR